MLGGLWGAVVGDALGVPVEFQSREERKKDPVTDMRGYGTFNKPPGTWSDDSSLMLCSVESLLGGFDTNRMGELFVRWMKDGYWTPQGVVFDIGNATRSSIQRMMSGTAPEAAGHSEYDNGTVAYAPSCRTLSISGDPLLPLSSAMRTSVALTHGTASPQAACAFTASW